MKRFTPLPAVLFLLASSASAVELTFDRTQAPNVAPISGTTGIVFNSSIEFVVSAATNLRVQANPDGTPFGSNTYSTSYFGRFLPGEGTSTFSTNGTMQASATAKVGFTVD